MTLYGIKFFYEKTLKRKWPHGKAVRPPSALQRRMIEDLQLAGMSERTQQMYVRAVRMLAEHYNKPPDQITEEELRRYFLHIKNDKKWSRAGITIALCGIKFFYEKTLKRKWPIPGQPKALAGQALTSSGHTPRRNCRSSSALRKCA